MFPRLLVSKFLLWKHPSACCWSYSKLRKTVPFRGQCNLSASRPMLSSPWCATYCKIRQTLAFQMKCELCPNAQNITLSHFMQPVCLPSNFFPSLVTETAKVLYFSSSICPRWWNVLCFSSSICHFPSNSFSSSFADFLCFSRVCVATLLFWKQSDVFLLCEKMDCNTNPRKTQDIHKRKLERNWDGQVKLEKHRTFHYPGHRELEKHRAFHYATVK